MDNLNAWKDNGQYFQYKGQYPIFFQETGKGPHLLLLHGFPTASWDWNKIWRVLTHNFHVLAPDFIGFGFSAKPKAYAYSILDQADMIEALLADRGVEEFHILAHDYGDTVAQELLARYFDRKDRGAGGSVILSCCFLNGGLIPEMHQPRPIQRALISPLGFLLAPFLNKTKLRKNFNEIFGKDTPPTEQEIDEFYALIEDQRGKYIFHKLIRYMTERKTHRDRWTQVLRRKEVPLRLIDGADDPVSGRHLAEHYRDHYHKDVVILEHIGHYPQTEAPERVLYHFLAFNPATKP